MTGERAPTSHERRAGAAWDASYTDGPAPWDTGGPQPAVVALAAAGAFAGRVLDAGCGSGENALHLAALGVSVVGVDVAPTAIAAARRAADARGLDAVFETADAFDLPRLGRAFDTVLDSGLFHALDAAERRAYAASLAAVTGPGATLHLLCFADAGPAPHGPHPVREREIGDVFTRAAGWQVAELHADRVATRFHGAEGAAGWRARVQRR